MGTYDTPGGAPRHDPLFDEDPPCDICGGDPADCLCLECSVCQVVGDPKCLENHGNTVSFDSWKRLMQSIKEKDARIAELEAEIVKLKKEKLTPVEVLEQREVASTELAKKMVGRCNAAYWDGMAMGYYEALKIIRER